MELRAYGIILRRWWWAALLPALVVSGIGFATYAQPVPAYAATLRFSAGLPPAAATVGGFDPAYYSWLSSEYFAAGLADWVHTGDFASAVSANLQPDGVLLEASAVQAALSSDYARSMLSIYVRTASQADTAALAHAVTRVLQTQNADAFPQLGGTPAQVLALDEPVVALAAPGWNAILALPLRVLAGLGAGLLLAFGAHYLDPHLHTRSDAEQLGITVIGQIPRRNGR
ncbi:hypothetical protein EMGBD1_22200 [Anaerolineaceae bacterium]|nr:hypothetical protein EMGBD1_22200 [Anaerolineaceae bacterium]